MASRDLRAEEAGSPATSAPPADPSQTFAIVVGIDGYPGFGDLHGACNDAEAFAEWLADGVGGNLPARNIRLRLGRRARSLRSARPIKRDIDLDLDELVEGARAAAVPSRLYLFFAGHGVAPGSSTAAAVMADAKPTMCSNLSFGSYKTWLARCRDFAEIVFFTDCCRTTGTAPEGAPQHDVCSQPADRRQLTLVAHAADVDQRAFEAPPTDPDGARGFFTSALLDGLRGAAVDDHGQVHAGSLAAYLDQEVRVRSGGRQWPEIEHSHPPLTLASYPPATYDVTVWLAPGATRTVQILDDANAEVASGSVGGGGWTVRLANGVYVVLDPVQSAPVLFRVNGTARTVAWSEQ